MTTYIDTIDVMEQYRGIPITTVGADGITELFLDEECIEIEPINDQSGSL